MSDSDSSSFPERDPLGLEELQRQYKRVSVTIEEYEKEVEQRLRKYLSKFPIDAKDCCDLNCLLQQGPNCYEVRRMLWALWELFFIRGTYRYYSGDLVKSRSLYANNIMLWRLLCKYKRTGNSLRVLLNVEGQDGGETIENPAYKFEQPDGCMVRNMPFLSPNTPDVAYWGELGDMLMTNNATNTHVNQAWEEATQGISETTNIPQFTDLMIESKGKYAKKTVSFCLELAGIWGDFFDPHGATDLFRTFVVKNYVDNLRLPLVPARILPNLVMRRVLIKECKEPLAKVKKKEAKSTEGVKNEQECKPETLILLLGNKKYIEEVIPQTGDEPRKKTEETKELENNLLKIVYDANEFWCKFSKASLNLVSIGITDEGTKDLKSGEINQVIKQVEEQLSRLSKELRNPSKVILHIVGHGQFREKDGGILTFAHKDSKDLIDTESREWINVKDFTGQLMSEFSKHGITSKNLVILQLCHGSRTDTSQNHGIVEEFLEKDFRHVIGFHGTTDRQLGWKVFMKFYKLLFATRSDDYALLLHMAYQDELSGNRYPRTFLQSAAVFAVQQKDEQQGENT